MILPTKSIGQDLALLTVGAQIIEQLERPATVNAAWDRVTAFRNSIDAPSALPFWWFALALDLLFATGAIDLDAGQLVRSDAIRAD
jgi:hypothetical protein